MTCAGPTFSGQPQMCGPLSLLNHVVDEMKSVALCTVVKEAPLYVLILWSLSSYGVKLGHCITVRIYKVQVAAPLAILSCAQASTIGSPAYAYNSRGRQCYTPNIRL